MRKCKLWYKIPTIILALYGVKCLAVKALDKLDELNVIKEQEKKLREDKAFSDWAKPSDKPVKEISNVEKYLAARLKEKSDEINT